MYASNMEHGAKAMISAPGLLECDPGEQPLEIDPGHSDAILTCTQIEAIHIQPLLCVTMIIL